MENPKTKKLLAEFKKKVKADELMLLEPSGVCILYIEGIKKKFQPPYALYASSISKAGELLTKEIYKQGMDFLVIKMDKGYVVIDKVKGYTLTTFFEKLDLDLYNKEVQILERAV